MDRIINIIGFITLCAFAGFIAFVAAALFIIAA